MSEVRGRSREDPMPEGRQSRGATPRPRSGAAAESARLQQRRNSREKLPKSKVRGGGREELPHVQGAVTARAQEGLEELSHVQGKEGQGEEIPLVQVKEQRLRFAGAAVKRYPTSKVSEIQVKQ